MRVMVNFDMSGHGLRTTRFAVALAVMLGQRLALRIPMGYRPDEFAEALREKFKIDLGKVDVFSSAAVAALPAEENAIYVSHKTREIAQEQAPKGAHILCTHGEDGSRTLHEGLRIAVPFGDTSSAKQAMLVAIVLVTRAKSGVIMLMHTTYHNPSIESADPREHMNSSARLVERNLLEMAASSNVRTESHVGEAPDLVNFVIETAIETSCDIIVTARGEALSGGYAEQIEIQSNMPVLIVAKAVAS